MGLSENRLVPLNPMVLLIIIPIKWLFHWEYTLFSDKPICSPISTMQIQHGARLYAPWIIDACMKITIHVLQKLEQHVAQVGENTVSYIEHHRAYCVP